MIAYTFDIFKIRETKLDDTCSVAQFSLNGFLVSHRPDDNNLGSGFFVCVKEKLIVLLSEYIYYYVLLSCIINVLLLLTLYFNSVNIHC